MKKELTIHQPSPASLIELAIGKGVDTVQLKELMDLQERWEKKESKKSFLAAMSKFQTVVPQIRKTKTANIRSKDGGSSFSYRYADLAAISSSIKNALNDCGLSYRWEFAENGNKLKCTCFISHKGGHTETTVMEAAKDNSGAKNEIQQTGSTQTYLQRYSLIGALGLSTAEEDNDGKTSQRTEKPEPKPELSEEEIMQQWHDSIYQIKTRIELTRYYLKNKKAIDLNQKVQAIMKAREAGLKTVETAKAEMA